VNIVVAGGSGFLGTSLVASLRGKGHSVSVLTRQPRHVDDVGWSPGARDPVWSRHVQEADVVVNLAGAPMDERRWSKTRKVLLRSSRVDATRALVSEILQSPRPPILVSASGAGFYGTGGDETLTEESPAGSDFLAALCRDWEREAARAARATRVILLRTGPVLSAAGGALPQLARPFWFFVGGPIGSGLQYLPWIHLADWVAMAEWAIANTAVSGPINATAPNPVRNRELAQALASTIGRPSFVRAPATAVRLALGEMADAAILNGQRVVPAKALALGFTFRFTDIVTALREIYGRTQARVEAGPSGRT
jgi:uncharacterized protein